MRLTARFRFYARLAGYLQFWPVVQGASDEEVLIGGQAVVEGVMMRAPHSYCVAVRGPNGEIVTDRTPIPKLAEKYRWLGWPLLRGVATLGQALYLGIKALRFSADVALQEEKGQAGAEPGRLSSWAMAANVLISLGFFIFLYKFLPLWVATELERWAPVLHGQVAFNLADGLIRLVLFLGFLVAIAQWAEIRRVFEYHGAEHKVVLNFESGRPVSVENAREFPTFHPRCGTSFLLVVMMVAILVYAVVPYQDFWMRFAARLALLPVIAGISYELIRLSARRQGWLLVLATPGLWLQRITTQPPSDGQLEVAIEALHGALELERQQGGKPVIA